MTESFPFAPPASPGDPAAPLVIILGPTAAGKTALAVRVAQKFAGEVLACDSTQVYRGFDIGTAKPTAAERDGIPHYLMDLAEPTELFTAGEYRRRALALLGDLSRRGRLPVLTAGTGLYLRALLEGLADAPERSEELRARLVATVALRGHTYLHRLLRRLDPPSAARISPNDTQKLIRAVEICLMAGKPLSEVHHAGREPLKGYRPIKIGIHPPRELLHERIAHRVRGMIERGWLAEVAALMESGTPAAAKPFEFIGYRELRGHLEGQKTLEEAVQAITVATRQYAKRQMTWFRKEPGVTWISGFGDDSSVVAAVLKLLEEELRGLPCGTPERREILIRYNGNRSRVIVTAFNPTRSVTQPEGWIGDADQRPGLEFAPSMKSTRSTRSYERVMLVGLGLKRPARASGYSPADSARDSLDELAELARSAGAVVAGSLLQMRESVDPATVVGRGKVDEIRAQAEACQAPLIVFDGNLTPVQQRNLERELDCRVIDRTQLILDIFAKHARSREGQLQVELAQLNYLMPRLAGGDSQLSRLGGGIGTRGPGEQKLETDSPRRIRDRVRRIGETVETLRRQRDLRRRAREAMPMGAVSLVGYTNAGKSTLFNALSSGVLVSSKMFATLDPTVRAVRLPSRRRVLFSDTVGFIRDLPKGLLEAFKATLEEVQQAALILHVTDVSNPHHTEQDAEVEKVLTDLGVDGRPRLHVFNKIDLLQRDELAALAQGNGNIFVSARTGAGLDVLLSRVDEVMPVDPLVHLHFSLPLSDGRTLALVHGLGRVLHSDVRDSHMDIEAELPESLVRRLQLKAR